jgi:uncharacterized RDD family membrane protein YckC
MHQSPVNQLVIRTPEGISFSMTLASPSVRFLAWLVDSVASTAFSALIFKLVMLLSIISEGFAGALLFLLQFGIGIGYSIFFEQYWRGQSPGKRFFRLRVMDAQGLKLQPAQVVIRNLLRFVDMLPGAYLLGGGIAFWSKRYQRLGDLAASTIVVRSPKTTQPNLEQINAGKFNSFREFPHLEARLRQLVTPAEASAALQAALRRDEFEPVARVQLFAELSAYFKKLVEFPPEITETISDEQYVRNVVDVLYRVRANQAKSQAETVSAS